MDGALITALWERAHSRCEYCRLPADCSEASFQIDHIIAHKHHGQSESENLALACYYCNSYKGPNIGGLDSVTGRFVRLYHPRRDKWSVHFKWEGPLQIGQTAIGRTTVDVLRINHPAMVEVRRWLIAEQRLP